MIGVKKKNGNIIPVGYRKKTGSGILTEDNLVKVKRVGSQIITFPQKANLLVDLDPICFMQNGKHYSVKNGSFTLWQNTNQKQNLGTITTSTPSGSGFYVNKTDKYWYIGRQSLSNIDYSTDLAANRTFTISLTFKCRGNPADWRDIWWFNNNDQFRCEWGGGSLYLFGERSLLPHSQFAPFTITAYNNITTVVNGRNVIGYLNGVESFNVTASRDLLRDLPKIYLAVQRNSSSGNLNTDMFIRDLRLWTTNLTAQEVSDLQHFVFRN